MKPEPDFGAEFAKSLQDSTASLRLKHFGFRAPWLGVKEGLGLNEAYDKDGL